MSLVRMASRGALLAVLTAAALVVAVVGVQSKPASAHFAHPGLEFHIAIDVDGDTDDDCDTVGGPAKCSIAVGSAFWVKFYLDDNDGIAYSSYDFVFDYTGVTSTAMFDYDEWPDCLSPAASFPPGSGAVGCLVPPAGYQGSPGYSTYEGLMARVGFQCDSSGTISMRKGPGQETNISEPAPGGPSHTEDGPTNEPLAINCVPPTPTPTPFALGGFSRDPGIGAGAPASGGAWWATVAAIAVGALGLGSGGWYARWRTKQ